MSAQSLTHISEEAYLEAERASEFRREYYDGQVYAMSGASLVHIIITTKLCSLLDRALARPGCFVLANEMRVRIGEARAYVYPDVVVVCGEIKVADDHRDTVLNPTLIIEVLSPSTEAHDRGFKFAQYRKLESLREYVLVSQTEPRIERFERQAQGRWLLSESVGLDAICRFASVECEVRLGDIYDMVPWPAEQARAGQ